MSSSSTANKELAASLILLGFTHYRHPDGISPNYSTITLIGIVAHGMFLPQGYILDGVFATSSSISERVVDPGVKPLEDYMDVIVQPTMEDKIIEAAQRRYSDANSDDITFDDATIEKAEGGSWVVARLWVPDHDVTP